VSAYQTQVNSPSRLTSALAGKIVIPEHARYAVGSFDADYLMFALGLVPTPEREAPVDTQVRAVKDALAPRGRRSACT
jgi:hypothetical protein